MVVVDTSFQHLQHLLKKKISLPEMEEVLADMGMELESVEGDDIKIEITAERIDLITSEGLARAINCYNGSTPEYEEIQTQKSDYVHLVNPSVKNIRPFTRSFVVKDLTFTDELIKLLMHIQEKIHDTYGRKRKKVAIGVYDLSLISFPITYLAKNPDEVKFIALGMEMKLSGRKILQKHPIGRNYAHLLEGQEKFPFQIDAQEKVLSMPPIINSDKLGKINPETKNIFVECTGSSADALDNTMNILATMFFDWGGKIHQVEIKEGKESFFCPNLQPMKNKVSTQLIKNLIGIELNAKEVANLLRKMGYNIMEVKKDEVFVSIPSVRTDIWHPVDIADDAARGYGYNNIKPTLPNISTIGKMLPLNILIEDLANFLSSLGLLELYTFALTNDHDQYTKMNLAPQPHISLGKNTQDKNLSMIRSWLLPEMIKALVANRNKEYPQNVFESGIVVLPDKTADVKARNVHKLTAVVCEEKADFTKIKQILDAVMDFLDQEYQTIETEHDSFIKGRVAKVILDGKEIGIIGELHPQVLDNWDLKVPVATFEIDVEKLS